MPDQSIKAITAIHLVGLPVVVTGRGRRRSQCDLDVPTLFLDNDPEGVTCEDCLRELENR